MLTTIPTYLALTDFGFAAASASEMTMNYARGKTDEVIKAYQTLWILTLSICTSLLAIAALLCFVPQLSLIASFRTWIEINGAAVFLIVLYSTLFLCSKAILAGFRAIGLYASGTMLYDAVQFLEGVGVLVTAYYGGGFRACATAYVVGRFLNLIICYAFLIRRAPWMCFGTGQASIKEMKQLLSPSLSALLIPLALALNLQGVLVVAGLVVSPSAVAIFVPVRTASRIVVQLAAIVNRATVPEISAAAARRNAKALKSLLRLNLYSIAFLLFPGAICFGFLGKSMITIWTNSQITPEISLVVMLSIAMVFHGIWNFASNALLAVNAHTSFAYGLIISALITIGVAIVAGQVWGLIGIGSAVVLGDAIAAMFAGVVFLRSSLLRTAQAK